MAEQQDASPKESDLENGHLVVSRGVDESIVIRLAKLPPEALKDAQITITIMRTSQDKARIGIRAPKCVTVYRKEVQDEIDRDELAKQTATQ